MTIVKSSKAVFFNGKRFTIPRSELQTAMRQARALYESLADRAYADHREQIAAMLAEAGFPVKSNPHTGHTHTFRGKSFNIPAGDVFDAMKEAREIYNSLADEHIASLSNRVAAVESQEQSVALAVVGGSDRARQTIQKVAETLAGGKVRKLRVVSAKPQKA